MIASLDFVLFLQVSQVLMTALSEFEMEVKNDENDIFAPK